MYPRAGIASKGGRRITTRWVSVGVILIFIGVAVAPSININVVKATNDNDLIEVTSQACGINGFKNTTMKLTKQQYQNLEQYLVDFLTRLNKTTTKAQAVNLFKEAVAELNKYKLLPKGMSVLQAQRFIIKKYYNEKYLGSTRSLSTGNQKNSSILNNWCCLFASVSNSMCIDNIFWRFFYKIYNELGTPGIIIWTSLCNGIYYYQPFFFWCPIEIGGNETRSGSVFTAGLMGIKTLSGNLQGGMLYKIGQFICELGATGYTGIKINSKTTTSEFYLGTAFHVNMYVPGSE